MSQISRWVFSHKLVSIILAGGIIWVGYALYPRAPESPYETAKAERATLVQEVSVTGKVESETSIDLAFERSGRISSVLASVGETVVKGDTILRLDGSDVQASLAQAEANIAFEEATLAKLIRGARPEEIQVSEVGLENAQGSLLDARTSLSQAISDGYTKTDDAIRNRTDKFFNNPRTNPELNIPITDFKLSLDLNSARKTLEGDLALWSQSLTALPSTEDLAPMLIKVKGDLAQITMFLEKLALGVNGLAVSSSLTQTTIDAWKTDVSVARTNMNAALSSVVASEEKWRGAKSQVALAAQELSLKKIGASSEDIDAQKARIASAKASASSYRAQLSKLTLSAPFSGIVTKQDGKQGAIAPAGTTIVSIQSHGAFIIEANVPEVDIAKLAVGDIAAITFDAFENDVVIQGTVSLIDPAERIIDGIPTYKITLRFEEKGGIVRSGMTANVRIETDRAEGVVAIPARAVDEKEGTKTVRVLMPSGTPEERTVAVGIRASDGRVAVLSGVAEGEMVITFDKSAK